MNEKKKLRRLPKRILSFVLSLVMVLTLMPGMSMEAYAAEPAGRGESWDILYSEVRANGSKKAYPVGTRIYMDIRPQHQGSEVSDLFMDSYDTAVYYKYVDSGTYDSALQKHYSMQSVQLRSVLTLQEEYKCNTSCSLSCGKPVKSGGYWIFNLDQGAGDEFYGVASSGNGGSIPVGDLDIPIKVHEHTWSYKADGATLKAWCEVDGCTSDHTTEATAVSLTLTASSANYSGSAYTGASVDATQWNEVDVTPPGDITYYLENGEKTTYENSGAAGEGQAPVNVGKYVAKISSSDQTASKAFAIKHVHDSWEYSADEATLTAECKSGGNGNGECTLSASENKISLSLTAEDAVYSGNVVEASYVGGETSTTAWKEETKKEAPNITYFVDAACENKTGENDGASSEGKAPINVGTYYAAITEDGATAKICFKITPKKFKQDVEVTLSGDGLMKDDKGYYYEWDDTVKTPTITVKDTVRNQVLEKDKEYSVNGGQSGYDIGSYTIILAGKGNYTSLKSDGINVAWEIRKATIRPTISIAGWTYGKKANKPVVQSTAEISGAVNYTYYTDDAYSTMTDVSEGATTEGGVPKNAGTYYVKALFEATDNYEETEATCSFTIQPKSVTIVPDDNQSKIYGDADPAFTYDDSVLLNGDTLDGCLSRAEGEDTGIYEIKQDAEHPLSNPNYVVTVASGVNFSIKQKKLTQDMITVKPLNYQFSGNENKPELVFDDKTLVVEGTKLTTNDTTVAGDTAATKYGVYTIIVTGKGNYKGSVNKTWFISPVKDTKKTWTGDPYCVEAMEGVDSYVKITYLNNGEYVDEAPTYTEPGEYENTYKMVVLEEGEPIAEVEGKAILTIEKAPLDATIVLPESIVYKQDYEPTISKNPENASVTYEYKGKDADDSAYSTTKPVNVGNYIVRATIGGEDGTEHYKQTVITKEFQINPDNTAPTGEITVVAKTWKSLLNQITFGMFFKKSKSVTITAEDTGSGMGTIQYYVAGEQMTEENLQQLDETSWVTYAEPFDINPNSSNVIYAKLTDKAGNVSVISSDGIVIYTDSEQDTAEIIYTRTTMEDKDAKVKLNGNTIKEVKNGDAVLTKDTDYTISEDGATITFKGNYLETLDASEEAYTITVSYNPLGKEYQNRIEEGVDANEAPADTTIALYVKKAVGTVTEIQDLTKTYDATPVGKPTFNTTNTKGTDDANVTIEYKDAYAGDRAYTRTAPVDAGAYKVRVTVASDGNYLEAVEEISFTIDPKVIKATVTVQDKTYDGTTNATATATVDTGIEDQTLRFSNVEAYFKDANVGTQNYVSVDSRQTVVTPGEEGTKVDNYNISYPVRTYASITPKEIGVSWGDTELPYTGSAQAPVAAATGLVDKEGESCGLTVAGAETNVGDYTATVTGVDNTNYTLPEATQSTSYKIVAVDAVCTAPVAKKLTYDGQSQELVTAGSTNDGTMMYKLGESGAWSENIPTATDAGEYTVYYKVNADSNYNDTEEQSVSVTIDKKEITISGIEVSNKEYDGTTDAQLVYSNVQYNGKIDADTLSVTAVGTFADKNAGTDKNVSILDITLSGDDAKNYMLAEEGQQSSTTASITAKAIGITWDEKTSFVYDGKEHAPTATATGLVGDDNCSLTISGAAKNAGQYTATVTGLGNNNYILSETAGANTKAFEITKVSLKLKVEDASKHIGTVDPQFSYSITEGALVEGETIKGITFNRTTGEEVGTYAITATEADGENPNYDITIEDGSLTIEAHTEVVDKAVAPSCTETGLTEGKHCSVCNKVLVAQEEVAAKGHTEVVDEAVEATCTTAGKTAGSHCSVCNEVIVAQKEVPALGHDWSGEWTIVKEATATTDGKRETICTRDGCGQKKYETIPATGTPEEPENPNAEKLDKDAEVEPDAPIDEATLDNKKSELLDAPAIFTEAEKQQIQSGTDARVWLDVKRTDESSIPTEDKKEVTKEAEKIMGENPMITYFDADLFKQVEGGDKTQIHEPGIDIQVTILIPDELLNHDRTMVREYKIIRLHYDAVTGESKVDVLSGDFDRGTGEFSFKTDKFSTFAIAYTDIQLVTGITLTADSATLTGSGETVQLTATVAPDNAVNKNVIWTSSDPNVATVDANGKVTAVGNGTCTITATTEDGSYTAICTIKVEIPDSDNGGNNGDNNSGDNNQSNEDANTPANTKEDEKPNVEAPKTGDAGNVTLWSLLFALSALALAGIGVARRKRSSSIEK